MKCQCGGLMILRQLTCDTEAHVCVNCGRDNMPRRAPGADDITTGPKPGPTSTAKNPWETPRTCPGCSRSGLIFSGRCGRCVDRKKRGLNLVTGLPLAESAPAPSPGTEAGQAVAPVPKVPKVGTCPSCRRPGMTLNTSGHCGRCNYRLCHGIDVMLQNQKPGIAAPRMEAA
ncbi:MAG: hypothetical protein WA003_08625 [Desulfuromonadaceae bacterium]